MTYLLAFWFGCLVAELAHYFTERRKRKVRLNLTVEGNGPMKIGDTLVARIAPTAADGTAAPVTGVVFGVSDATAFSVAPAADGLSAVYTALTAGTGRSATVTAVSAGGVTLTDTAPLDDVVAAPPPPPTPEAVKLNLTVAAS